MEEDEVGEEEEIQNGYSNDETYKSYVKLFSKLNLIKKYFIIDDEEVVFKGKLAKGTIKIKKKGF